MQNQLIERQEYLKTLDGIRKVRSQIPASDTRTCRKQSTVKRFSFERT